ncbi:DNA cytosine methyltransferase, partial [Eubacterium callanderi]|uniref:DNA cytosine methyltransferase n=2 Tax=Clostridia TaxID=186801 RepID=UPI0034E08FC1|nr:DNA cytosine methyltransferase [Eubacterium callanderi]
MNAIDLFSGAGGLSIALRDSGFKIIMANEINPRFAETHKHNLPDVPLIVKDINELTTK